MDRTMKIRRDYSTAGHIKRTIMKICRREKVKSIEELCSRYDLPYSTVRNITSRDYGCILAVIKICESCGVSADELLGIDVDI